MFLIKNKYKSEKVYSELSTSYAAISGLSDNPLVVYTRPGFMRNITPIH